MVIAIESTNGRIVEYTADASALAKGPDVVMVEQELRCDRLATENELRLDVFLHLREGDRIVELDRDDRENIVARRRNHVSIMIADAEDLQDAERIYAKVADASRLIARRGGSGGWVVDEIAYERADEERARMRDALELFDFIKSTLADPDESDVAARMGYTLEAVQDMRNKKIMMGFNGASDEGMEQ